MNNDPNPEQQAMDRRNFLRACGRYGLLGVMGLSAIRLGLQSGSGGAGEICGNSGVCRGCAVFSRCGLPGALSARNALSALDRKEND